MKETAKRVRVFYLLMQIGFILAAVALAAIPVCDLFGDSTAQAVQYVIAGVFWFGVSAGTVFLIIACCKIKPERKKLCKKGKLEPINTPGAVRFVKKTWHIVLYVVFAVGLFLAISDLIFNWLPAGIVCGSLAIAFLAFMIHSVIDGKNFNAYKYMKEGKK